MKPIIITAGEPAGVGADLAVMALANPHYLAPIVVLGDKTVLQQRAAQRGLPLTDTDYQQNPTAQRSVWHLPLPDEARSVTPSQPQTKHADYILQMLTLATQRCRDGEFTAMVTAPISKATILAAGHSFSGQTEYIADLLTAPHPVMLLTSPRLKVALATTHLPLKKVATAINKESLLQTIQVLHGGLQKNFGIPNPKIAVCGLNPHAGEGGYLGTEERDEITPAIQSACALGMTVSGPHAADTLIGMAVESDIDCVLAMYHDQALPAIKLLDFDNTVNVTLGLPFLRTSPDHGIAVDKVASPHLRFVSMDNAIQMAINANAA